MGVVVTQKLLLYCRTILVTRMSVQLKKIKIASMFFKDYFSIRLAFFIFTAVLLFEQFFEFIVEKPTYTSLSKSVLGNNQVAKIAIVFETSTWCLKVTMQRMI